MTVTQAGAAGNGETCDLEEAEPDTELLLSSGTRSIMPSLKAILKKMLHGAFSSSTPKALIHPQPLSQNPQALADLSDQDNCPPTHDRCITRVLGSSSTAFAESYPLAASCQPLQSGGSPTYHGSFNRCIHNHECQESQLGCPCKWQQ